jgi:hypothetical protein
MQVWAYCRIVCFFTWERAEHGLTLRSVNKDQNPTLAKTLLYAGTCQEPHRSGTKDFFQKKDERKKHNLADNIYFFFAQTRDFKIDK